ncbi:HlyD family type I secretion periplasmic adaptor subunit [Devosia aurantiaca]|uniref:Membrane fusion protein (MFP) family protein n=1 Tax=Devosia aurantiaca TaxID=2714858 RepID=A0A6M1T0J1_9HYPH|nr:HlyD family type I secretion periplasmic adaptor subunit [Devosia aurantiaca]NGP18401.1 HlyD family type I secretion periplasmic adaptor subunit [Devosia aurantiaca]
MSLVGAAPTLEWYADVPRSIRKHTLGGLVLVVTLFGGFGLWAMLAPLAAAVIAPGSFVATGENKIVQHLEGGIIQALLVREGDTVVEGQDLVQLDETAARANARQMLLRSLRLEGIMARLKAESHGLETYIPPPSILAGLADPEIKSINDSQADNFKSSRAKLETQLGVLEQNIAALEYQRNGSNAQIASMQEQRDLLAEDYERQSTLLASGLVTRSAVNVLQRAMADADGDIARLQSEVQTADAQIMRFRREMDQARDTAKQAALDEMQSIEAEFDAVREQIRQADNVLSRTTVKAPVSGTIVRMYYHTAGGVIESGKAILEILPSDVPLIIEAQIPRMQIDEVHKDQVASVRLSALNQRTTPMLEGKVYYVSADAIAEGTGAAASEVYIARISVAPEQLARVRGFTPTPGMPAEILIQTHERTFFEYLSKPITDSMSRAFREY